MKATTERIKAQEQSQEQQARIRFAARRLNEVVLLKQMGSGKPRQN